MKIIKLHSLNAGDIYINVDRITTFSPIDEVFSKDFKTFLHVEGDGNSYKIKESAEQIIKIISESKDI